ncbi:Tim10/DDP family zinc finger-domain-containing protein [Annulohypoxylon moriforme]|nr:Tim10/DDP family zinc finger-domain-containing protein [Annulohypoxylon moriforme]
MSDFDLSKLNDNQRKELEQFLDNESQKNKMRSSIHSLTEVCFKKCVTGPIRSGQLDKNEESCLSNCANRFVDVALFTVNHLAQSRLS